MAPARQTGTGSNVSPTPADILRWVAAAAPKLWFPSVHAEQSGQPRDALDEPLWVLRQAGLIQVGDWVRNVGQGFRLTPTGERALHVPNPVPVTPPPHQLPPDPIPDELDDPLRESPVSEYAIGETARRSLLDPAPSIITPILLMVNVGWFVFGGVIAFQYRAISDYLKGSNDPVIGPILRQAGAVSGPDLLNGEWWRLFTCCFVHVGLFHLLCNMVTLALLGSVAEGVWGRWRFSIIYLLSGLAGSVTTMAFHPQMDVAGVSANLLLGGASGNLWGVTTAVIAWLVRNLKHLPPDVGSEWVRKLVVVAVLNGVISLAPGISLEAHLGGGVGGLLVALCLARMRGNRRETTVAAVGLTLLITVFAVMLPLAMNRTGDWQDVKERHNRVKALRAPADARIQPP